MGQKKGFRHSEESRNKMKLSHTGIYPTEETRLKMSASKKDIIISQETRIKIKQGVKKAYSEGRHGGGFKKGHPPTKGTTGKQHTEEWKANQSERMKQNNPMKNPVVCLKVSKTRKERSISSKERNSNWQGGISFEPYCEKFNEDFKKRVRLFFGDRCVECGCIPSEYRLHVHHVNFDKKSCCNDTTPLFVPLCRECHNKTQHKRIFYQYSFTEMINYQYGGKCYLTKEEMLNQ